MQEEEGAGSRRRGVTVPYEQLLQPFLHRTCATHALPTIKNTSMAHEPKIAHAHTHTNAHADADADAHTHARAHTQYVKT